jgi:hypothetical protein
MKHYFELPDAIRYILAEITFDLAECIDKKFVVVVMVVVVD